MRWPRQVMSLLVVLVLLAGPPMVLWTLVGPPVPGWPTGDQVREWVEHPLTEDTLSGALTIAAWLIWLLLAYTVVIRVVARLRTTVKWLRRVPLPTPMQATAGGIAGAAVFGVSTHTASPPPPQPLLPATVGTLDNATPPEDGTGQDDGILVSGGWLPREAAEQVTAAAALVWLRRRRAYQPRTPGPQGRDDTDLAPLPATVTAVQSALADHPTPTTTAPATSGPWLPSAPADTRGRAGVGLTGPGALAAGRGMLVTALLAGRGQSTVSLVVTQSALTTLLGTAAETLGRRLPGLAVVDDIVHLFPFFSSHVDGSREHVGEAARPAPGLIVDVREATSNPAALTRVTASARVNLVVLGPWPTGRTWHVDPAGHTTEPDAPAPVAGPRLCVLDQVAATDLLTVVAHTTTAPPDPDTTQPTAAPVLRVPRQTTRQQTHPGINTDRRRLELRVLGEPALLADGRPVTIRRSAALQTLVLLAAHPDGADTARLTAAIWPGLPRHTLTGRLYTTLSDLRTTIRDACGLNVIDHTDDRYRLNPTHLDADLWRFHQAVRHATTAVTDRMTAWQAVIDAYPDDLAAGRTWPWLDPMRETVRRHVLDAYVTLADTAPDTRDALALLQDAMRVDPYNTDLHTRTVNTLTELGDHRAVHELRESYTRRLAETGIRPGDDTPVTSTAASRTTVPHP